ncbi:3-hydroxyacyl-CoA dehydrogenase [Mycena floridula]|nr:3-hydroxyacyl-CoA dehydrogenase [Mycena floridula]
MKIENRTFIISGGASGLGLATAKELLKAGAFVAIFDRADSSPIENEPRSLHVKVDVVHIDQIESGIERTMAWTKETRASLGGVINCAGIGSPELTIDVKGKPHSVEPWNRHIAVNLSGTFHLTRLAAKHLVNVPRESGVDGERGAIIMVSSSVASEGQAGQVAYAATKGGIESMTLPMARDFARHGVRVVTIAPSLFISPLSSTIAPKFTTKLISNAMLYPKRYGNPEDFAATVKWILTTSYVNAEVIKLSGGTRVPAWL